MDARHRLLRFGLSVIGRADEGARRRDGLLRGGDLDAIRCGPSLGAVTRRIFRHSVDRRWYTLLRRRRRGADVSGAADTALEARSPIVRSSPCSVAATTTRLPARMARTIAGPRQEQVDGGDHFPMYDAPAPVPDGFGSWSHSTP